jgi:hypothetical protein
VQPYQKTADAAFYQSLLPEQPAKPQDAPIDPFASEPGEQNAPSQPTETNAADDKAEKVEKTVAPETDAAATYGKALFLGGDHSAARMSLPLKDTA